MSEPKPRRRTQQQTQSPPPEHPRRRTRSYYAPEEYIPLSEEWKAPPEQDTPHDRQMAPEQDVPHDMPPRRTPVHRASWIRTRRLLETLCPPSPFRRPHSFSDCVNMLLDILVWLPKFAARLVLHICRYLRSTIRYAHLGYPPLWKAFQLTPYAWTAFYLLLGLLTWGGVRLLQRGTMGATVGGIALLLPPLMWCGALLWVLAGVLYRWFFFSHWTFLFLELLCLLGIAGAFLLHPLTLIASALLPLACLAGDWLLRNTTLLSFSPADIASHTMMRQQELNLRQNGIHAQAIVTAVHSLRRKRYFVMLDCVHPITKEHLTLHSPITTFQPEVGTWVHVILDPELPRICFVDFGTKLSRRRIRKRDQWAHMKL